MSGFWLNFVLKMCKCVHSLKRIFCDEQPSNYKRNVMAWEYSNAIIEAFCKSVDKILSLSLQSVHLGQLSMAFLKSVIEKQIRPPGTGTSILQLKTQTILCISLVSVIGKECACFSNGCIKHLHFQ